MNIDVYNPKDEFYNNICFSYSDGKNDLTLNNRRKDVFPNTTIECSAGCNYTGLNASLGYSECECQGEAAESVGVDYLANALDALLNNNLKLVVCAIHVFVAEKIFSNFAFIFTVTLLGLIGLEILIFYNNPGINSKTLHSIVESDGTYYEYVKEKNQEIEEKLEKMRLKNPYSSSSFKI